VTEAPPPIQAPPPAPSSSPLSDERQMALIVYLCYLGGFVVLVTGVVGLVLAYVNRDTAPDWLKSHFEFQIRTFWIGMLFGFVSLVLCFLLIGFPLMFATMVWFVVRCALGIDKLLKREAYPNPRAWLV
jgi:uncharacterized membrane protein